MIVVGDYLNNIRVGPYGYKVKFTVQGTGFFDSFWFYNIYSFDKPMYHGGDGGETKVTVNGRESTVYKGLKEPFLCKIPLSGTLKSGLNEVVFESTLGPNAENRYTSVNCMFSGVGPGVGPGLGVGEVSQWYNGSWFLRDGFLPIYGFYNKGSLVSGFQCYESWFKEPRPINGCSATFHKPTNVNGLHFRVFSELQGPLGIHCKLTSASGKITFGSGSFSGSGWVDVSVKGTDVIKAEFFSEDGKGLYTYPVRCLNGSHFALFQDSFWPYWGKAVKSDAALQLVVL